MKNPWQEISLSDYENHMSLNSVKQLQALSSMMKQQFDSYSVGKIMILGIAGGNGLEHIPSNRFDKVYGVDVNSDYLEKCKERYKNLDGILECICTDLTCDISVIPSADIVVANLLIEYIGYECFQNVISKVNPRYVSCIIQINTDNGFVSDSPYVHSFDKLESVHSHIDENGLVRAMDRIDFSLCGTFEEIMPNRKKLLRLDFKK